MRSPDFYNAVAEVLAYVYELRRYRKSEGLARTLGRPSKCRVFCRYLLNLIPDIT